MEFTRAPKSRAYRSVVEQVANAIIGADLQVGDALPPEREIALQLGISRSSVREAMRVLQEAGLVARKAGGGGGTTVASAVVPVDLLGRALELSRKRIADMLEVRAVLELTAAELAASRAVSSQLRDLELIVEEAHDLLSSESPDDPTLYSSIDPRFHVTVAKASQNDVLLNTNRTFAREVAVATEMIPLVGVGMREFEVSSMTDVVRAIRLRSPSQARIAMAIHVSPLPKLVDRFFEDQ